MSNVVEIASILTAYPSEVREIALAASEFLLEALPGAAVTLDESAKIIGYGYGPGYRVADAH